MDCRFKVSIKNTYKAYRAYCLHFYFPPARIIFYSIVYILLPIILIALGIILTRPMLIIYGAAIMLVGPLFTIILFNSSIKRTYLSNKLAQEQTIEYEFFDTHFTAKSSTSTSDVEYDKLHKIIETKKGIYLMLAKNQGFIFSKSELPSDFCEFLKNIKKQYSL